MNYQVRSFKGTILALALFWFVAPYSAVRAQEIFYFSDRARDLEVSADAEALLSFPAPPFARVCQPSGILDLYPVDHVRDLHSVVIPRGIQGSAVTSLPNSSNSDHGAVAPESEMLARHLKLVPKRTSGVALCAIRLANEQVINVRFVLSKMVSKPIIEFKSTVEKAKSGAVISQALGPINLFRSLVSGGDLAFMADETPNDQVNGFRKDPGPSRPLSKSTDSARYRLLYVGTDRDLYKAWKFEGTAERDFAASLALKNAQLGEVYFSSFKVKGTKDRSKFDNPQTNQVRKGDDFTLFVLSRGDISPTEMLERLP